MLNYNTKKIDPRWFLIIILLICSCIITFNNYVNNTYCLTYQIVQCPDNFTLTDYSIEAETDEEANLKIQNLLTEKGFEVCNYDISITDTNIKIVETGKTEEPETTISEENEYAIQPYSFQVYNIDWFLNGENFQTSSIYKTVNTYEELIEILEERIEYFKTEEYIDNTKNYKITEIYHKNSKTIITKENFKELTNNTSLNIEITIAEEPTEPEIPEIPEEPTNTNLQEVIDNLQEIQKLLYSIIIIINIVLLYMFTRSLFRI